MDDSAGAFAALIAGLFWLAIMLAFLVFCIWLSWHVLLWICVTISRTVRADARHNDPPPKYYSQPPPLPVESEKKLIKIHPPHSRRLKSRGSVIRLPSAQ